MFADFSEIEKYEITGRNLQGIIKIGFGDCQKAFKTFSVLYLLHCLKVNGESEACSNFLKQRFQD